MFWGCEEGTGDKERCRRHKGSCEWVAPFLQCPVWPGVPPWAPLIIDLQVVLACLTNPWTLLVDYPPSFLPHSVCPTILSFLLLGPTRLLGSLEYLHQRGLFLECFYPLSALLAQCHWDPWCQAWRQSMWIPCIYYHWMCVCVVCCLLLSGESTPLRSPDRICLFKLCILRS